MQSEVVRSAMRAKGDAEPEPDVSQLGHVIEFMRLLWRVDHSLQLRSRWMQQHLGVTGPQRLALRIIGSSPGISASSVAATMMLHRSTITGILKRIERVGLIERFGDAKDGRKALFRLTKKGEKLNKVRTGTVENSVRATLEKMPLQQLAAVMQGLQLLANELDRRGEQLPGWRPSRHRGP
jgi:DNA-binding MarR family transcriptional regulator